MTMSETLICAVAVAVLEDVQALRAEGAEQGPLKQLEHVGFGIGAQPGKGGGH
jgi:hypothetical protein